MTKNNNKTLPKNFDVFGSFKQLFQVLSSALGPENSYLELKKMYA